MAKPKRTQNSRKSGRRRSPALRKKPAVKTQAIELAKNLPQTFRVIPMILEKGVELAPALGPRRTFIVLLVAIVFAALGNGLAFLMFSNLFRH